MGSGGRRDDEVGERACLSVKRRTWELAGIWSLGRRGLRARGCRGSLIQGNLCLVSRCLVSRCRVSRCRASRELGSNCRVAFGDH